MGRKPAFSPRHPKWADALALRQAPHYFTYEQIADRLRAGGVDVSARQVRDAFNKYAPVALRLPERAGDFLRRSHAAYLDTFDSWETLKLLILDTIAELGQINQQLEDETLGLDERDRLLDVRRTEVERAWRFTTELERLRRELDPSYIPGEARAVPAQLVDGAIVDPARLVGAGAAAFLSGMQELEKRVLESLQSSGDSLSQLVGATNVSLIGTGDEDDEEEES